MTENEFFRYFREHPRPVSFWDIESGCDLPVVLGENDYIVYCWRYAGDLFAKIGMSRAGSFFARISMAKTHDHRDVELLGVERYKDRVDALDRETYWLGRLNRCRPDREWIKLDEDGWWCLSGFEDWWDLDYFRILAR